MTQFQNPATVLGLESSCDETAAAIVRLSGDRAEVLSERVFSQISDHAPFGGVVPEIAARAHAEKADLVVREVLSGAGLALGELDAVAATAGPGLIGGVLVGLMTGKALAMGAGIPFLPINHLEGHALSPRLAEPVAFPYLLLLVSGGHCQFIAVHRLGAYERLGSTIDDAAGEAFDKTAKVLGLGFPGGPALEKAARAGDRDAVDLPRPLLDRAGLEMSFAGLKTAALRAAEAEPLTAQRTADVAASFQRAVADILAEKSSRAMHMVSGRMCRFIVAGGVAANQEIRSRLRHAAEGLGFSFFAPPLKWCTDNGAMIALAGAERLRAGALSDLTASARPRWPLDESRAAADPVYGAGKRGAKV